MKFKAILGFALVLCCLSVLSSCAASPNLVSIQITPSNSTLINPGDTVQLKAMGTYTHGRHPAETLDVTNQVAWASSNEGTATISSDGIATAVTAGTTSISASMNSSTGLVTSNASIQVNGGGVPITHDLTSMNLIPSSGTITGLGNTAQFIAIGVFNSSPTTEIMTNQVSWQSENPSVVSVNSSGLVTAVACPTNSCGTLVTATGVGPSGTAVVGTAGITVTTAQPPPASGDLISLSIIPTTQSVSVAGETAQFVAIGTFNTSPTTQDMTDHVKWLSSDVSVATIDSSGLATSSHDGTTTITATGLSASGNTIVATSTLIQNSQPVNSSPTPSLTVSVIGAGKGNVVSSPTGINCGSTGATCSSDFVLGSTVTLTGNPDAGSSFVGWSVNCTPVAGTPNKCTIALGGDQSVGAIFN
jgi:hypothetical protein